MTLKENEDDVLLNGTLVRSLNDRAHHLVGVGCVGIIIDYLPRLGMYKVQYNIGLRKVVRSNVYREEFEVITDED